MSRPSQSSSAHQAARVEPAADDEDAWARWRGQWSLAPGVTYLNHGSFGPPPLAVIEDRQRWFGRLAANPMDFFVRALGPLLAAARARLGELIGTAAENLVLVENATTGMSIVTASFALGPGDEVLITDHDYGAVQRTWQAACDRAGARLVVQPLPVPFTSADDVAAAVLAGVTPRTRLLVFSHVTSPTALVFPAATLCRQARELGLAVCIDGPHALAMQPVALDELDCDYYTASGHKWLSAPFGSGFLYVHPRRQLEIRPAVLSWGRPLQGDTPSWRDEFNWVGTRDPAAFLALPAAINFLAGAGMAAFRRRTHHLAHVARERITSLTGLEPLSPDNREWYGSMVALSLPDGPAEPLQAALWQRYGIEVPIVSWQGRRLIRVSCHLYTTARDLDLLVHSLGKLLAEEQASSPAA